MEDKINVIVDLDGTLAIDDHRRPLISSHSWSEYFAACVDDPVNESVKSICLLLAQTGHFIHILTGRSERVRAQTTEWLGRHAILYHNLLMRSPNDYDPTAKCNSPTHFRPDSEVKEDMINSLKLKPENTLMVLDDRDHMVIFWRELGFDCWQVRPEGLVF